MKLLILLSAIYGLTIASPIASLEATTSPSPSLTPLPTNIPGDGSPQAWALLNEASTQRTTRNKRSPTTLFKRDTFNCKGSSNCFVVTEGNCNKAVDEMDDNTWYRGYTSFQDINCTYIYICENGDYGGGWPGWFLKQKMWAINDVGGCRSCGSNYFWGTCRVTYNYTSWSD